MVKQNLVAMQGPEVVCPGPVPCSLTRLVATRYAYSGWRLATAPPLGALRSYARTAVPGLACPWNRVPADSRLALDGGRHMVRRILATIFPGQGVRSVRSVGDAFERLRSRACSSAILCMTICNGNGEAYQAQL